MPPAKESQKAVTDHLNTALNEISSAMLADDASDPQIQQILTALQQGLVQVVHAIRQAKSQQMAQAGQQGPGGQQMSAGPGQQGYGNPTTAPAEMGGSGGPSAPPGGGAGGDEMARVLGPSNRGMQ